MNKKMTKLVALFLALLMIGSFVVSVVIYFM